MEINSSAHLQPIFLRNFFMYKNLSDIGMGGYYNDSSRQFLLPENKQFNPANSPNQNSTSGEGLKRYTQIDARSADYNNFNFSSKVVPPAYKRTGSADDNMTGNQISSFNSAFEARNTSQNDHSNSANLSTFGLNDEENKFRKLLKSEHIDLEDFPVPPIPKEFKNSTQLFVPDKMEEVIKKLTLEAEELVFNGEYEQAKRVYLKVAHLNPYDGVVWKSLGHIYLLQDKLMESFNWFQGCLFHSDEQTDPTFWFAIGKLYDKLELYEYSITALTAIFDMEPNDILKFKVHCKLGMVCCKIYELEKASEHFRKALLHDQKNHDQNIDILIKLGLIEEEKGDLTKAISNYEAALKIDPYCRRVHAHIAWCYYKAKNNEMWKESISVIDSTTPYTSDPEACVSTYIKARIHEENRNLIETQRLLWKCLEFDGENPAYWSSLGVINFDAGNREKAFEYTKTAIDYSDKIPEIIYNYAILFELNGQEIEASKQYQKLLKVWKYEEFVKKRLMWIQGGMLNSKNSLHNSIIQLKHPENIISNSLWICKPNKKTSINDISSTFKVVSRKKLNEVNKSPQKVRFLNVPSLTSEDKNNEEVKEAPPEIKQPPLKGAEYLKKLREAEKDKSKSSN